MIMLFWKNRSLPEYARTEIRLFQKRQLFLFKIKWRFSRFRCSSAAAAFPRLRAHVSNIQMNGVFDADEFRLMNTASPDITIVHIPFSARRRRRRIAQASLFAQFLAKLTLYHPYWLMNFVNQSVSVG